MRVLVVRPGPAFSVADVCRGWVRGLQEVGCEVADFNLDDRLNFYINTELEIDGVRKRAVDAEAAWRLTMNSLFGAAYTFWPDVIVIVSGFLVSVDAIRLLRAHGHKVVTLFTESPYEDKTQLERAAAPDVALLNDPTNLEAFREVNPRTWYEPHCYDATVHCPGPAVPELKSDFAWVGTAYPSRIAWFESVDWHGLDVLLGGNWQSLDEASPLRRFIGHPVEECTPNDETVNVYRSTKASVNTYRREAERPDLVDGWSMGPRETELAATRTFFLTEPRGENREVLPATPTFESPGEFGDKLRWYLSNDAARARVVEANALAIEDRTFANAARRLLTRLDA